MLRRSHLFCTSKAAAHRLAIVSRTHIEKNRCISVRAYCGQLRASWAANRTRLATTVVKRCTMRPSHLWRKHAVMLRGSGLRARSRRDHFLRFARYLDVRFCYLLAYRFASHPGAQHVSPIHRLVGYFLSDAFSCYGVLGISAGCRQLRISAFGAENFSGCGR